MSRHHGPAHDKAARALYAKAKAQDAPCWRCGGPIDYDADRRRDPLAFTAGHTGLPAMQSGTTLAPEHRACNVGDGARLGGLVVHGRIVPTTTVRTRDDEW